CCGWFFFFSSRRRHTRFSRDWSSDVCSSDLIQILRVLAAQLVHLERGFDVAQAQFHRPTPIVKLRQRLGRILLRIQQRRHQNDRSEERRVGKEWRSRGGAEREHTRQQKVRTR